MRQMINGEVVEMTAEEIAAFQAERNPVPAEVAMHRVKKAALLTPWGDGNLKDAIEAAFTALPAPKDELAAIEWGSAPNLVRDGATTVAVMAILGITEAQRDELLIFAASLP